MILSEVASSQEAEFSVSPSPVGSGARAAGMADAFVAIADDATAASWNPAGLVQLERFEFSIVGSFNGILEEFEATDRPEFVSTHRDSNVDLNFMSVVYPLPSFASGRNATISLSYQKKFDFSRNFKTGFIDFFEAEGQIGEEVQTVRFDQSGGLSTITPAIAIELTHHLSIGVAMNFWRKTFLGESGWEQNTTTDTTATIGEFEFKEHTTLKETYENFSAENFSIGLLWNFRNKWNLGVRYNTAFTGTVSYERDSSDFGTISETREIDFPATLSVGLSYRKNDRLTLSIDISRTDWQDFIVRTEDGSEFSLIDFSDQNDVEERSSFDPAITVRFGFEYLFLDEKPDKDVNYLWSLRGGLFFDQEPASGRRREGDGTGTTGDPDDFYGIAVGVGLLVHDRVNFDIAYQLRFGEDVNSDFYRGVKGFEEDVYQHRLLLSAVIYF